MQTKSSYLVISYLIIFLAICMVFTAGCITSSSSMDLYTKEYAKTIKPLAAYSPKDLQECKDVECWCFVCHQTSGIFGFFTSRVGGYCYLNRQCSLENINAIEKKKEEFINPFMIGIGPSSGEFGAANPYCNNKLKMTVEWLVADENVGYPIPDVSKAVCFLDKEVFPVYILYSKGKRVADEEGITRIADDFATKGQVFTRARIGTDTPVGSLLVVTEMNMEEKDIPAVIREIEIIDQKCNAPYNSADPTRRYCLIAVAPKLGDTTTLDALMAQLAAKNELNKVDLVAFGVTPNTSNSCNPSAVWQNGINFAAYVLNKHGKPSIIPYFYFQKNVLSKDGSCTWSEADAIKGYGDPNIFEALKGAGIIGVAPYALNSTFGNNPLECKGCAVAESKSQFEAWFGACQVYTTAIKRKSGKTLDDPASTQAATDTYVFPNRFGGYCPASGVQQDAILGSLQYNNKDTGQSKSVYTAPKSTTPYFSCSSCLSNTVDPPFKWIKDNFKNFAVSAGAKPKTDICTLYPEVESFSSRHEVDPLFVRAIIAQESGFEDPDPKLGPQKNECEIAKVCSSEYMQATNDPACFPAAAGQDSECFDRAYRFMEDPRQATDMANSCKIDNDPKNYQKDDRGFTNSNPKPSYKYCALGLMQSLEPPYTYWPSELSGTTPDKLKSDVLDDVTKRLVSMDDLKKAKYCDPEFNPFVAADSICIGTLKISTRLKTALKWVNDYRTAGLIPWNIANDKLSFEKDNVLAYYIVAMSYRGVWTGPNSDSLKVGFLTKQMKDRNRADALLFTCKTTEDSQLPLSNCIMALYKISWTNTDVHCKVFKEAGNPDKTACTAASGYTEANKALGYGYEDFFQFLDWFHTYYGVPDSIKYGYNAIMHYYYIRNTCQGVSLSCPDWKQLYDKCKMGTAEEQKKCPTDIRDDQDPYIEIPPLPKP